MYPRIDVTFPQLKDKSVRYSQDDEKTFGVDDNQEQETFEDMPDYPFVVDVSSDAPRISGTVHISSKTR